MVVHTGSVMSAVTRCHPGSDPLDVSVICCPSLQGQQKPFPDFFNIFIIYFKYFYCISILFHTTGRLVSVERESIRAMIERERAKKKKKELQLKLTILD